jgi:16S rRNA (guanine527-N7)-methyltransferase
MKDGRKRFLEIFEPSNLEMSKLDAFVATLIKWNPRINLVAANSLSDVWTRHIIDSAQLFEPHSVGCVTWLDLGSGGGFPGFVIAALAEARAPGLKVRLVESDQRKAAFLRAVSRETTTGVEVIVGRAEEIEPQSADIVSARALAPLSRLLDYAERHLVSGGRCAFLKGETHEPELREALAKWQFTYQKESSLSHPSGTVLSIGDLRRA